MFLMIMLSSEHLLSMCQVVMIPSSKEMNFLIRLPFFIRQRMGFLIMVVTTKYFFVTVLLFIMFIVANKSFSMWQIVMVPGSQELYSMINGFFIATVRRWKYKSYS